jgi:hypothetical protein
MSLVALNECRALVKSSLSDSDLLDIIDRTEQEIEDRIGAFQDATLLIQVTETGLLKATRMILTRQPFIAVVSITINGAAVDPDDYVTRGFAGMVSGIPASYNASGPAEYTIVYRPIDQRSKLKRTIIDLVRLAIEQTAMESESVAGEYSYQAPNWEKEHQRILRRVVMVEY